MSFTKHNKTCFLIVFALMAVLVQSAFAQSSTTGSIAGFVKDPSGAAVPGVTVTATGSNSIRPQSAVSGTDGSYTILNLPPGKYSIVATGGKGFAKYEQTGIEVNLGITAPGEVRLQLATSSTEVTVSANSALVDVASTTTGSNVSTDQSPIFRRHVRCRRFYTIAPTVTRSGFAIIRS